MNNRLHNCKNPNQGEYKRVLCCCSAGLLRSPTAAHVLARDFGHNTRSCGVVPDFALVPIDQVLVEWAHEIVVMDEHQEAVVRAFLQTNGTPDKRVINLNIADNYPYRVNVLQDMIRDRYLEVDLE